MHARARGRPGHERARATQGVLHQLQHEIEIQAKMKSLKHPNFVSLHCYFQDDMRGAPTLRS